MYGKLRLLDAPDARSVSLLPLSARRKCARNGSVAGERRKIETGTDRNAWGGQDDSAVSNRFTPEEGHPQRGAGDRSGAALAISGKRRDDHCGPAVDSARAD